MTINVSMGTWAKRYTGESRIILELAEGSVVSDALKQIAIPEEQIGMTSVNMEIKARDYLLHDGDELKLFPPIIGG